MVRGGGSGDTRLYVNKRGILMVYWEDVVPSAPPDMVELTDVWGPLLVRRRIFKVYSRFYRQPKKRGHYGHVTSGCSVLDQLGVLADCFRPAEFQQSSLEEPTLEEL